MKYRCIILFGAPGSGKGTQGKILGAIPNCFHCSSGDLFRNLRPDSPLGKVFIKYSSRGQLVPDDQTIRLWKHFMENCVRDGRFHPKQDILVLDGIPRNLHQAKMLKPLISVAGVFYLKGSDEQKLIQRIQRRAIKEHRLDDANLEVIRDRLHVYEQETKPLLNFYGEKLVHSIAADQAPIEVLTDILEFLKNQ